MGSHRFISYSTRDGQDLAIKLHDKLEAGPPAFKMWLDKRDLITGVDWEKQIVEAIRDCDCLVLLMTRDSVRYESVCRGEWSRALSYKKPVVPLLFEKGIELPLRMENRQYIDFTGDYDAALAKLRGHLEWLKSPAGELQRMKDQLADAERDLDNPTLDSVQEGRIKAEIEELQELIKRQQRIVNDPAAARARAAESIRLGIERERRPEKPISGRTKTKFINPPPGIAPSYFQDRHVETKLLGDFLNDEAVRQVTIVGRGGIGKTAMSCRLLKSLESGKLPDDLGEMSVDGIVYLSERGSRRVNMTNIFNGLTQLLPDEKAQEMEAIYKDAKASTESKMQKLLEQFPDGRIVVLLDNFEDCLNEERGLKDSDLDETLQTVLKAPQHAVRVIITTRVAPKALALVQPQHQKLIELDEGLPSPYAENILREMDVEGKVGLKEAEPALLDKARIRTRGYPRALEALFAILSADRDTTLDELLLKADQYLPENVVEVLVGEAFNRLNTQAQQVMEALAVYDRPVSPNAVDFLLQPFSPGMDSALILKRLVNMQFVRRESGQYFLHPVDRTYAFARILRGEESDRYERGEPHYTQYGLLHRGADYFKQTRKPRAEWKTIKDLEAQLAEFDLRCAGNDYDTAAYVLLDIDFHYLLLWGHVKLMMELHERLQGKPGNPDLKQDSMGNLGTAYWSTGQIQKAIACYEQALALAKKQGSRQGEGVWLGNLSLCYADLGQIQQAIDYSEQALQIAREIGDTHGEGVNLGNLGNRYAELGQIQKSIDYYEQALQIAREIGDRQGEGIRLGNLGNRYAELGQIQKSIDYYEQALQIAREIGDRAGEGRHLGNLGDRYASLWQIQQAIDYYEQGLAITREIGDRRVESYIFSLLGTVHILKNRYTEALPHLEAARKIGEDIENPDTCQEAHRLLACVYLCQGNLVAARVAVEKAHSYDVPQNNQNVAAMQGIITLQQGDMVAAKTAFADAVQKCDKLLGYATQNYGALDAKGLALAGLVLCGDSGQKATAIECFQKARAIVTAPGIVKELLQTFDALVQADKDGLLTDIRKAAAGEKA